MKKDKTSDKDELREEYKPSDFPGGLVRGKYAKRLQEFSTIHEHCHRPAIYEKGLWQRSDALPTRQHTNRN
ncbi:MAG: hypothetical protein WCR46_10495 [Deltaproteobacteria bacterium]|jgi:hypothetical protein